jgi:hypothetical protein
MVAADIEQRIKLPLHSGKSRAATGAISPKPALSPSPPSYQQRGFRLSRTPSRTEDGLSPSHDRLRAVFIVYIALTQPRREGGMRRFIEIVRLW